MDPGALTAADRIVLLLATVGAVLFTVLPAVVVLLTPETPPIKRDETGVPHL
jgi:hypothetical protein